MISAVTRQPGSLLCDHSEGSDIHLQDHHQRHVGRDWTGRLCSDTGQRSETLQTPNSLQIPPRKILRFASYQIHLRTSHRAIGSYSESAGHRTKDRLIQQHVQGALSTLERMRLLGFPQARNVQGLVQGVYGPPRRKGQDSGSVERGHVRRMLGSPRAGG